MLVLLALDLNYFARHSPIGRRSTSVTNTLESIAQLNYSNWIPASNRRKRVWFIEKCHNTMNHSWSIAQSAKRKKCDRIQLQAPPSSTKIVKMEKSENDGIHLRNVHRRHRHMPFIDRCIHWSTLILQNPSVSCLLLLLNYENDSKNSVSKQKK